VQRDRGRAVESETFEERRDVLAVSGTAVLLRVEALRAAALGDGAVLDPRFGSYHEDLDLGLRLTRLGWRAAWVGAARVCHLGSATGGVFRWRHPWWLLANRWRALAGNLTPAALLAALPRLLRGEARAVHTLARSNPRAAVVAPVVAATLPALVVSGWARSTPGQRLRRLPESP
jgi:GT2 family glycosyltransferase